MNELPPLAVNAVVPEVRELYEELEKKRKMIDVQAEMKEAEELERAIIEAQFNKGRGLNTRRIKRSKRRNSKRRNSKRRKSRRRKSRRHKR